MAEYISKDELKAAILKRLGISGEQYLVHSEKVLVDVINKMSPADVVERKTGKWIGYPECLKYANAYSDDHIVCSACEECFSILDNDCERFNFCPHCGAKMIGGNEDV